MRKNVWILNHYATNMFKQKGGRHYWFAKNLKLNGYEPTIFCANTYHNSSDKSVETQCKYSINQDENTKIVYVKTRECKTNGIDRVFNMLNFAFNLLFVTKKYENKTKNTPDIIIASSVHPLTCVAGIFIAKRYKIPCIVEIRDLWPESIVEFSEKLTKKNILIKILYQGEKWIYKKADAIIFTRPLDYEYIKEKKWEKQIPQKKCFYINNGVDLKEFDYNKEKYKIKDEDLDNNEIFKVVYTGSIRHVNNVEMLIDSAKKIKNSKIKILIWGDGDNIQKIEKRIIDEKIENVELKYYIEKKYIPYVLSKSDLNIIHYKYSSIFRFGTSQNKNFEYLASGKPILNTMKIGYDIVLEKECGYTVLNQSADNIAKAIDYMYNLKKEKYIKMCENSREVSKEYDFEILTKKLIEVIEKEGY